MAMNGHRLASRFSDSGFARFFAASAAGVVVDILIAYVLNEFVGLPLPAAAGISLLAVAGGMYFVHEFWTFRSSARSISFPRMAATVASAIVGLMVRWMVLYASSSVLGFGERFALLQLGVATCVSFLVNYVLVSRIVGRPYRAQL